MRYVAAGLAAIAALVLVWFAVVQARCLDAAQAEALLLEAQRDSAVMEAERLDGVADSAMAVADSLSEATVRLEAEALARASRERHRADSLEASIDSLLSGADVEEELRERIAQAVAGIRDSYEVQLRDRDAIISGLHAEAAALRTRVEVGERSAGELRRALAAAEEEIGLWQQAAHPGILERIRQNVGPLAGATVVGLLAGLIVG